MDESQLLYRDLAAGRARLYTLLARIAAGPVDAELETVLAAVPTLQAGLALEFTGGFTQEEARAARYEAIFGREVLPYAGFFLAADGMLGGPISGEVSAAFQTAGYVWDAQRGGVDHLATLLGCMAHLCAAEVEAWEDGQDDVARHSGQLQAQVLADWLLPWLPPLAVALYRTEAPFYAAFADLLLEAIIDHAADLMDGSMDAFAPLSGAAPETSPGKIPAEPVTPATASDAIPVPDLVQSGIRDVAVFLCLPARAGLYLQPADIQWVGQQVGLAAGFGTRSQRLYTLLETVALPELPPLLEALLALGEAWSARYAALGGTYAALAPWLLPWQARLEATLTFLQEMARQAQAALAQEASSDRFSG